MKNKRESALEKLKVFLINPGMFSLIVIGNRGVGKRYTIEKAFESIQDMSKKQLQEKCLTELNFVDGNSFALDQDFDKLLKDNEFKTLVIDGIDELDNELQRPLFKALSTTNGKFGKKNDINLRILFTSNKSADDLREDGKYLTGMLWDRISQLIVEFPSYKEESGTVVSDFYATWDKMKFETIKEYSHFGGIPKNTKLQNFIETNAEKFEGGFRDLDKIACLYFNYRIFHYGNQKKIIEEIENKVVDSVKEDFFSKSQMQGNSSNDHSVFEFKKGLTHQDLLGLYKIQLRNWAINAYGGTIANAENKLGFKKGTMKNYVKTKVTTKAKEKSS
jgi:hypothetical protein